MQDWVMNSRASFYVTPNCQWFTSYDAERTGRVHLGSDFACAIKGVGDVKLKFKQGSTFTFKNICHVLELIKSLISIRQFVDQEYTYVYGDNSW